MLQSLLRFLGPFRIGMFENDSLIQFLGVGNVRLPFLKLRRFKEAFRTLSATAGNQTQGEKHAYEQQCAFSKDHGKSSRGVFVQKPTLKNQSRNPSCRLAACTPRDENRTSRSTLCHPRRLSPTPVPDLIGDPIKEWIQAIYEDPGFLLFSSSVKRTTLDSRLQTSGMTDSGYFHTNQEGRLVKASSTSLFALTVA